MRVKNSDLVAAAQGFSALLQKDMPIKTAFALAKLAKKMQDEGNVFNDVRRGLEKKYPGAFTKDQHGVRVPNTENADWPKFEKEFNELLDQDVEIVAEKVKVGDVSIEPQHLVGLLPFIEVE